LDVEAGLSSADVVSAVEGTIELAEGNSRELVEGAAGKVEIADITTTAAGEGAGAAGGLGGKITTSRSATAIHPSMLGQNGKCLRRLISIVSLSSI
jgi:hypothetical protein